MADILGAARIVIRAIDGGVKRDLDRIMSQSTAQARKQGESMGDAFSRGFAKNTNANMFNRINDGLLTIRPNAARAADAFSSFVRRANVANVAIGGVVGGLSALVGGAGALVGALGGAGASLAVIPTGIFAMISAMTVGRLAFKGMGEAIQKIKEDGVNPFVGISESRANFAAFAAGIDDDMQTLRDAAADSFLPPLQRALETFFTSVLPTVRAGISEVGAGMGAAAVSFMNAVARAEGLADLGRAFSISGRLMATAGEAIGEAWDAMLSIIVASGPIAERYMNFIRDRLGQFASYLNVQQASGELEEFFNTSGNMAAQFGRILDNIFAGFGAIIMANFGPGTGGGYLLDWLESATAKFAAMDDTMGGAAGLRDYFRDTAVNTQKILSSIGALISELLRLGAMKEIGEAFDILATGAPALARMVEAGIEVMPVVAEIIVALFEVGAALSNTGWDMAFFTTIRDIAQSIADFFKGEMVQSIMAVTGPILGQMSAWSLLGTIMAGAFTLSVGFAANFANSLGFVWDRLRDVSTGLQMAAGAQGIGGFVRGLQNGVGASFTFAGRVGQNINQVISGMMGMETSVLTSAGRIGLTLRGVMLSAMSAVGTGATIMAAKFKTAMIVMGGALRGPLGIILGVIALLVGAFIALYNTSDEFRAQIDIVWASITSIFEGAGGGIAATIGGIGDAIAPLIPQIAGFFGTLISTVMPILSSIFSTLSGVFQQILPVLGTVFQSLAGVFGSLISSIGPVIASLVSGLLPVFQAILGVVGPVVSIFASALVPMFAQLAGVIGPVVEQLGGILLETLAQLAPAFQPIMDAVQNSLIPAFQNLVTALAPIIPMLIESVLPAFMMLVETVMTIVPTLVGMLIPAFVQLVEAILPIAVTLIEILVPAFASILEAILPLVTMIISTLIPVFVSIISAVAPLIEMLVGALVPVFQAIVAVIGPLVEALVGALVPILTVIMEVFANILPILGFVAQVIATVLVVAIQILVNVLSFLIPVIVPIVEILANVLVVAIEVVVAIIVVLIEIIAAVIQWFADMGTMIQGVVAIIGPAIAGVMTWISEAINNAMLFIQTVWTTVWNAVVSFVSTVWAAIVAAIQNAINFVMTIIQTVLNVIATVWNTVWNAISTVASAVWGGIVAFVTNYINNVMNIIRTVLGVISTVWNTIWTAVSTTVSNIWNGIVNGVSTAINGIRNVISAVLGAISGVWSSIWGGISSTFMGIWNGITGAIQGLSGIVSGAFNGMVGIIRGAINGVISVANGAISALNGISVSIPAWVPVIGGSTFGISIPRIPMLAKGGVVDPRGGGTLAMIAEAGRPERVEPLDPNGLSERDYAMIDALTNGRGPGVQITVVATPDMDKVELAEEIGRILEWQNRP